MKLLKQELGVREMSGTRLVLPRRLVDNSTTIKESGLTLELIHLGWAATPGDLAVFERTSGVLFAGGLVDVHTIPELRDSNIKNWLEVLPKLESLPVHHVVPAHGCVAGPEAIGAMFGYLKALEAKTRELYEGGVGLAEATSAGDLPQFKDWARYSEQHPGNVHRVYLELEEEALQK